MRLRIRMAGVLCVVAGSLGLAAGATAASPGTALKAAEAPSARLDRISTDVLPGTGGVVYRYQQEVGGVPVLDAQAVVHDYAGAAPALVADNTAANVPAPGQASVSRTAAIRAATAAAGVRSLAGRSGAALVVAPREGDALAWRVTLPSAHPLGDYEVLVDATSGRVLSKRNLIQDFSPPAKIYDPNPIVENGGYSGIGNHPGADHHDNDTSLLTSLRLDVNLDNLSGDQECLKGTWAKVKLGKKGKKVCKPSLDWTGVTRSSDKFEALMAYFHIDRTQEYIQSLGFGTVNAEAQVLLPDAIKDDNSFYRPSVDTITYGTGGVDDAEDADVIVHEYGHAIQDDQVPGFGSSFQAGALGEGFGDYMAASQTQHNGGSTEGTRCIFDWDGVGGWGDPPPVPCGRRADDDRTFDDGINGNGNSGNYCDIAEIHCTGQTWASALMDIRSGLANENFREDFDADVIASQFDYATNESFKKAAEALIDADQANNSGAFVASICTEMQTDRGLSLTGCI
jgi:Fungalysin metallopeptidase (M36)/Fungalysin/Thermolysin Propeptide Motif